MNDSVIDQRIDDQAGLFRPGWIAKVVVYGVGERTARGDGRGSLVVLLLAERARSEGARSTRAVKGSLATPL